MRQSWKSATLALAAAAVAHLALLAVPWRDLWPEPPQPEKAVEVELQAVTSSPPTPTRPAPEPTSQITTAGPSERKVAKPQDAPSSPPASTDPAQPKPAASREGPTRPESTAETSEARPTPKQAPRMADRPTPVTPTKDETDARPRTQPQHSEQAPAATNRGVESQHRGQAATPDAGTGNRAALREGYQKTLEAHLARYQQYPAMARMRRQQGTVTVAFTIDQQGRLLSSKLLGRTPFPLLNREAIALIERASPFPDVPTTLEGEDLYWELPVHFRLNEQSH